MNNERFLGADSGGTAIKFVVTDAAASVLEQGEVPTDPNDAARSLAGLATRAGAALGPGGLEQLAGVGLACAGIVNPETGWLGNSPNLPDWQGLNLREALTTAFGPVPTAVANDVNAALYGEYRHGAGRGATDLVMIALGTGVGGGVMVAGRLLLGCQCGAGEIGHMVLDLEGPPCSCGGRGCLEAWAGSKALLRAAHERVARGQAGATLNALIAQHGAELSTRDLAAAAAAGDAVCSALFAEAGRRLGQAVGNLVNLLDPERVIIGGGVARAGELILGPCRALVPQLVLAEASRSVPVVEAELGARAAAVGAACLARETLRSG